MGGLASCPVRLKFLATGKVVFLERVVVVKNLPVPLHLAVGRLASVYDETLLEALDLGLHILSVLDFNRVFQNYDNHNDNTNTNSVSNAQLKKMFKQNVDQCIQLQRKKY